MEWHEIVTPYGGVLITGDTNTGKSALGYYLLECLSTRFGLKPVTVGIAAVTSPFENVGLDDLDSVHDCILLIDESAVQLPLEKQKHREIVTSTLTLAYHRHQIPVFVFHLPRLALGRYLPLFKTLIFKRPPHLTELAGKPGSRALASLLDRALHQFQGLGENAARYSFVVRTYPYWEGMMVSPLPSFWNMELRESWRDCAKASSCQAAR